MTDQQRNVDSDGLQRYHLASCKKYQSMRGIYPNDRRLTDEACNCGLENAIAKERNKLLDELQTDDAMQDAEIEPNHRNADSFGHDYGCTVCTKANEQNKLRATLRTVMKSKQQIIDTRLTEVRDELKGIL